MRLTEIIPGKLYQGPEFPKYMSTRERLSVLKSNGVDIVVNLYRNPDEKLEDRIYKYLYFPMSDGKVINPDISKFVNVVVRDIRNGHVAFVHCHAGRNRSGFFNGLVVAKFLGLSGIDALNYVREKRPRAIDNINFEKYLREL